METENNNIIAKFMKLNLTTDGIQTLYYNKDNSLRTLPKYHLDWNWLMEVVEKIYQTDLYYDKYIDFNSSMFSDGKIELSTNKEPVYNACVEFIKWYNENK